ncbi:MAG: hypothetical protein ACK52Q_19870, partial [Pseudanabaena sp.]
MIAYSSKVKVRRSPHHSNHQTAIAYPSPQIAIAISSFWIISVMEHLNLYKSFLLSFHRFQYDA